MNRFLFLDMDGVITSYRTNFRYVDPVAVNFIKQFALKNNFQIVISSSWRRSHSCEFFVNLFGELIATDWRTTLEDFPQRHEEIQGYFCDKQTAEVVLILDDEPDAFVTPSNVFTYNRDTQFYNVLTSTYDGLTYDNMKMLRTISTLL